MANIYVGFEQHAAVAQWAASSGYSEGDIVRPLAAPAANEERCFRCTTAGTSGGSEPAWDVETPGATTNDNDVVWTEVTGQEAYAWSAPHARLGKVGFSGTFWVDNGWVANGDTIFVSEDHAETAAGIITVGSNIGSAAGPIQITCVDHTGSVPPVSADLRSSARVQTTGNNEIRVNSGGSDTRIVYRGIRFRAGSGASGTANIALLSGNPACRLKLINCELVLLTSGASSYIDFGGTNSGQIELVNTTVEFGSTSQHIRKPGASGATWKNTPSAIVGATIPNALFGYAGDRSRGLVLDGVDLSALGSGKTIVANNTLSAELRNCKLGASVTVAAVSTSPSQRVDAMLCDSGDTNYRSESYQYPGTLTTETGRVRSGGASDGVTPVSWKVVTTANAKWILPVECFSIGIWNETVGSPVTATIEIMNDGTTLKNDEVWADIQYMGDASFPLASEATNTKADPLTAGSNLSTSSETWDTTGIGSPVKQKIEVTFTPEQKGYIRAVVKVGRASKTVYIDPKITLS